jgi:hypothetical protein
MANHEGAGAGEVHTETTVVPPAYPYSVLVQDSVVFVDTTAARTINLPEAGIPGRLITIKDATGTAGANNISVTTIGGTITIDGATTFTMNTNYQSLRLIFNGANYLIL